MSINFEYFKVFYTIARCQNISKAAEELFLSRPTITQELQKLEDYVGYPLFYRHSRGVSLTERGQELFLEISPAVQSISACVQRIESARSSSQSKDIRICFTHPHILHAYEKILSGYAEIHPEVHLQISISAYKASIDSLYSGFAEISFGARHERKPFSATAYDNLSISIAETSFGKYPDCFICHEHMEFPADREISLREFSRHPLIFYLDRDPVDFGYYLDIIGQPEEIRNKNLYLSELDAIFSLMISGDYISIIPSFHLKIHQQGFCTLQIVEPLIHTEYLAQHATKRPPSKEAFELVDYIKSKC